MLNQRRIEEIHIELNKLQRNKELYETCCSKFSQDIKESSDYFYSKKENLDPQCKGAYHLKDNELLAFLEGGKNSFGEGERTCGDGIRVVNEDISRYQYRYEGQKEELFRELKRLEGGQNG